MSQRVEIRRGMLGSVVVSYDCENCGESLTSPLKDVGVIDTCPECNQQFVVPGKTQAEQLRKRLAEQKRQKEARQRQQKEDNQQQLAIRKEQAERRENELRELRQIQAESNALSGYPPKLHAPTAYERPAPFAIQNVVVKSDPVVGCAAAIWAVIGAIILAPFLIPIIMAAFVFIAVIGAALINSCLPNP